MDELVTLIVQKTGISQEDAQKAVQVMAGMLKSRLPAPIAGEIDNLLGSGAGGGGGLESALESEAGSFAKSELSGLLGKL
jgi:hypothetical protein